LIVAVMTDLLEPKPDDVVLEIGTGLGYQSAVLTELATRVYSVEIIDELAQRAMQRLKQQGYTNVEVRVGNAVSRRNGDRNFNALDAIWPTQGLQSFTLALFVTEYPARTLVSRPTCRRFAISTSPSPA
jgi:protein-L-isoaspartate O-methyltransferase